jgi:hypothetical protein
MLLLNTKKSILALSASLLGNPAIFQPIDLPISLIKMQVNLQEKRN